MTNDTRQNQLKRAKGGLGKFETGGEAGPVEDRNEYEQRLDALPPDQRELAQESARLADLCQYLSTQRMDLPPETLQQIGRLSKLSIAERIRALKDINRTLMEYVNDAGQDSGIRQ